MTKSTEWIKRYFNFLLGRKLGRQTNWKSLSKLSCYEKQIISSNGHNTNYVNLVSIGIMAFSRVESTAWNHMNLMNLLQWSASHGQTLFSFTVKSEMNLTYRLTAAYNDMHLVIRPVLDIDTELLTWHRPFAGKNILNLCKSI